MKTRYIILITAATALLLFMALVSQFVWIPDIFSDRVIVLGQMKTPDGDSFQATEKFVGDGYLLCFDHTNKFGRSWHTGFDGDSYKLWSVQIQKTNRVLTISVPHHGQFFYDIDAHEMTDTKGEHRVVMEDELPKL